MIIDCISDLHGHYPELEGGDLLIVAGDLTERDQFSEYQNFFLWLCEQKYTRKILIAGNHDNHLKGLFRIPNEETDLDYLCDSGTEFEGLKIWGSPWTQWFHGVNPHCKAFMLKNDEDLAKKWALIPNDIDILITHSPPYGILDAVERGSFLPEFNIFPNTFRVGSLSLKEKIQAIKPRLHVFGHIHECFGQHKFLTGYEYSNDIQYVNASYVNEHYKPVNKPIRVVL